MKILCIFAHPDDETFSCSGTLHALHKKGHKISLITATRGEKGQLGEPPVTTQENLGKTREKELRNAAKIVGISKIYFLDFIDGTLSKHPLSKLTQKILPIVKKESPDVVITFNEEGGSRHPDHKYMHHVVNSVFEQYLKGTRKHVRLYYTAQPRSIILKLEKAGKAYTAFGRIKGTPDEEITTVVDIKKEFKIKVKALMCHVTQRKDWERFISGAKDVERRKEYFILAKENVLA